MGLFKRVNVTIICLFLYFSPGVVVTPLQRRGGMSDEAYEKVSNVSFYRSFTNCMVLLANISLFYRIGKY